MFSFREKPVDSILPNQKADLADDLGAGEKAIPTSRSGAEEVTVPLIAEELQVGRRIVNTGVVRLHKQAEQHTETVDVPLTHVTYQVEHVPVDRAVTEAPAIRQEGDTTIYPVLEERVIITRELRLKEEVRVTRVSTTTLDTSTHSLLRETLTVERESLERQG